MNFSASLVYTSLQRRNERRNEKTARRRRGETSRLHRYVVTREGIGNDAGAQARAGGRPGGRARALSLTLLVRRRNDVNERRYRRAVRRLSRYVSRYVAVTAPGLVNTRRWSA